jgi:MHS family citrate/tricarballylate:H+ symporter-like MFS transporter
LSEVVPVHIRASGFSMAFSLAAAFFGTFTPLAATFLISASGSKAAPSYWLMFAAYCSIMATAAFYRKAASASSPQPAEARAVHAAQH